MIPRLPQPSSSFVMFCGTQRSGANRQQLVSLFNEECKLFRGQDLYIDNKFEPKNGFIHLLDHNFIASALSSVPKVLDDSMAK